MKICIIISINKSETIWNAFRLANFALNEGDEVKIFLLGEGVEYEAASSEKFDVKKQIKKILSFDNAQIFACGTCLQSRGMEGTKTCPTSTLKDLHHLIKNSDKIITF